MLSCSILVLSHRLSPFHLYPKSRVMSGMVRMLPSVVMNVNSVMSAGFLPYYRQNIVPKLATGIAITTVLILFTTSLTPHTLKKK